MAASTKATGRARLLRNSSSQRILATILRLTVVTTMMVALGPFGSCEEAPMWSEGRISPRASGTAYAFAVAANESRIVCVGWDVHQAVDRLWTSDDSGMTWTERKPSFGSPYRGLKDVACNGSMFVAIGHCQRGGGGQAIIATSEDGIEWTVRDCPLAASNRCVLWDGHQFLVGGDEGRLAASPDGITWTAGEQFCSRVEDIAYDGRGLYVCCEYKLGPRVYSSPNAVNWTLRYTLATGVGRLSAVNFGNGQFHVVGKDNKADILILRSSDGISWTPCSLPVLHGSIDDISFNGREYITSGLSMDNESYVFRSADGVNWVQDCMGLGRSIAWHRMTTATVNGLLVTVIAGDAQGPRIAVRNCGPKTVDQPPH